MWSLIFSYTSFLDAKSWVSILNGLYHKPWGRKSNLNLRVQAQHLFPSTTSEASIKTITVFRYFLHWYWVWKCWSCTRKFRPFTNSSRGCTAKKITVQVQWLTIAIVFELIYYTNGNFRVWLTSMNIDSKFHAYLSY